MAGDIRMNQFMAFIHEDVDNIFNNKYAHSSSNRLETLPDELIAMIAKHLPKKDLLILRSLGNRSISHAIDHGFVNVFFSRRTCQTTIASIARLETLTHTRFAKRIWALEVYIVFDCPLPRFNGLAIQTEPCVVAALSSSEVTVKFGRIFRRLPNLKNFMLCAPPGLYGMSDWSLADALPALNAPGIHPNLRFRERYHFVVYGPEHNHVIDTRSIAKLVYALVPNLQDTKLQLDKFEVIGFADSIWQSRLTSSPILLHVMRKAPALQGLTCLKLQLEMWTFGSNIPMKSLVKLIGSNANLKSLNLSVGPLSIQRWLSRSENWAPLLRLLGSSPPFRLRSLELDGLVTSTIAPTLARIIYVHSSSMRRVVLRYTNFHYPNTLCEFFTACANSGIQYYMSERFLFHETRMLVTTSFFFHILEDDGEEELHRDADWWGEQHINCCSLDDKTCHDWVEVVHTSGGDSLLYDNENGKNGDGYMYNAFMGGVLMVKDGAIIDC